MSKVHTTLYVEEETVRAVEKLAAEADLDSTAEAWRRIISVGVDEAEIADLMPEHVRILQERERIKEQNRLRDLRGGFEGRVLDELKKRWRNGYRVAEIRDVAIGFRDEARILWPDDQERREDALNYVDRVLDAIEDAEQDSDVDRLDVEEVMSRYEGVARGRARQDALDYLVAEAERLLSPEAVGGESTQGGRGLTPEQVVDRLAARTDVDRDAAEKAVETARRGQGESRGKDE